MYDEKKNSDNPDSVGAPPTLTQHAPPDEPCKTVGKQDGETIGNSVAETVGKTATDSASTPANSATTPENSASTPADSVAGGLPCQTPPSALSELAELRQELTSLRAELSERNAMFARIGADCADFRSLYPDVSQDDIPDSVWEMTERGVPLSASYALWQRKEACKTALADRVNRENANRATDRADASKTAYFTRDEVAKMSRADIRRHYGNILLSMSKWN